jgi:hypothetical protein
MEARTRTRIVVPEGIILSVYCIFLLVIRRRDHTLVDKAESKAACGTEIARVRTLSPAHHVSARL